jgi:RNA polymerase primary sigma factor
LDDAGSFDLLSAEDERAQARELLEMRREYWRALLSCPSLLGSVLEAAKKELSDKVVPTAELDATAVALNALRKSSNERTAKRLADAVEALAAAMSAADADRILADAVADDVCRIAVGDDANVLQMTEWPRPEVFQRYLARVRKSRRQYTYARNQFICANLRLVVKVAQRYGRCHMPLSDRVQEGNLGLMKAVDRFDPERGVRFSTYAAWWIRHAVTRALVNRARTVRIPAHLHTIFTKVRGARRSLRGELGREPTLIEVSKAVDVPLEKVKQAVDAMELRSVALEAPVAGADSPTVAESLEDQGNLDWTAHLDARRNTTLAEEALEELAPMEVDIVTHRFGLHGARKLTLQKLGEKYSLSRERIRQLQNRALRKIRRAIESDPTPTLAFA